MSAIPLPERPCSSGNQSPTPAFLRLPLTIRQRIYALTGLIRSCPIDFDNERFRWSNHRLTCDKMTLGRSREDPYFLTKKYLESWHGSRCAFERKEIGPDFRTSWRKYHGCIHPSLPIQLLRVSRQIHDEAFRVLWSQNTFLLGPSLSPLPSNALATLTSLEVRLTFCSCITGHKCHYLSDYVDFDRCSRCHKYCKRGGDEPLAINVPDGRELVTRWTQWCEVLRSRHNQNLELSIICDCQDLATASEMMEALDGLTNLQDATIRLAQSRDPRFQELAKRTVEKIIRVKLQSRNFPFERLPVELQELVLSYTDLLAPDDISWNEPYPSIVNSSHAYRPWQKMSAGIGLIYSASYWKCCFKCTNSRESCACPSRHSAYTSRLCKCWDFPKDLFLVSRSFNQMAAKLLFSRNRISLWEITDHGYREQKQNIESGFLAPIIKILQGMPASWSSNLTWLRIAASIARFSNNDTPHSQLYNEWGKLANQVKQFKCLANLTVELDFANSPEGHPFSFEASADDEDLEIWGNIAVTFKCTNGQAYKDFFIRLAFDTEDEDLDWKRWRFEQQLEKAIKGPDYDAVSRGKYRDRPWFFDESTGPKSYYFKDTDYFDRRLLHDL